MLMSSNILLCASKKQAVYHSNVFSISTVSGCIFSLMSDAADDINIDYQSITYNFSADATYVGFNHTGNCNPKAQLFTKQNIIHSSIEHPDFNLPFNENATHMILLYRDLTIFGTEEVYFRFVAEKEGTTCSDIRTQHLFYRFEKRGKKIKLINFITECFCKNRYSVLELSTTH